MAPGYSIDVDHLLNAGKIFKREKGLFMQSGLDPFPFPENYIAIRKAENRIYSIDALKALPYIPKGTPHDQEWRIRSRSARRLLRYLNSKKINSVLEIGCGNGWLSNLIATSTNLNVVGLDVNLVELEQAAEAFGETPGLHFVFGNILDDIFAKKSFDVVLFAASLQYFEDLQTLFPHVFPLLKENGEIHIIDSPFYTAAALPEARKRSSDYFASLGHLEMEKHYYHHSIEQLKGRNVDFIYSPHTLRNRVLRKWFFKDLSPFPWIRIKQQVLIRP